MWELTITCKKETLFLIFIFQNGNLIRFLDRAPECVNSSLSEKDDDYSVSKSDIWSFGMFLSELLTLNYPYCNYDEETMKNSILSGVLPKMPQVPPINDIIRLCTKVDPKDRPTARELCTLVEQLQEQYK